MDEKDFAAKEIINYTFEGTFGDKQIPVCRCEPYNFNGINVILFHGVHSSANLSHFNKFRVIANLLVKHGFRPWLVETSRKTRDRDLYHSNMGAWINAAFSGKIFSQEREDDFRAYRKICELTGDETKWLWGFSLGGIIALSVAAGGADTEDFHSRPLDTLIISGTGMEAYPDECPYILKLPVLTTLTEEVDKNLAFKVRANRLISFRGEHDEVFGEDKCIELVNSIVNIPEEAKTYIPIPGADHALRHRNKIKAPEIMEEMLSHILNFCNMEA